MMSLDAERQKAVMDAAMQLFAKKQLNEISLEQVTKASGVSAFDIIRHYQSSENILRAVLERELELMSAAAALEPELRMPGETLKDELHVLAGVILDQYRRRVPFLTKLLTEAMADPRVGALFYTTFIKQGRLLFTEFLRVRMEHGELREDVDVEAAAAIFLAALTGIMMSHEMFGGKEVEPLDDERVLHEMCDSFLKGIAKK
jgi:AcrR family transcriptional regulator